MERDRSNLKFNKPIPLDKQKAPSANYIFNQHLSKLLTEDEKLEFNFREMDQDESFIDGTGDGPGKKRSRSVMHSNKKSRPANQHGI